MNHRKSYSRTSPILETVYKINGQPIDWEQDFKEQFVIRKHGVNFWTKPPETVIAYIKKLLRYA